MGFFCNRNPSVHILVNGEAVLGANAKRDVSAALSSRAKLGTGGLIVRRGQHSAGNVTGWTLVDFLALPAKAQVTITYDGTHNVQGFLGLRKL